MDTLHLGDGHLPGLETCALDGLEQFADHEFAAERVLRRETGGIHCLEAGQEFVVLLQFRLMKLK